jgi:DNA invertase Pin-like site-specific DNA recombinase
MFFNILATFAEFEADLIRMRTREGMAIARPTVYRTLARAPV